MVTNKADKKADTKAVSDRGEATALMEPLLIAEAARNRAGLPDLAFDLAKKSAGVRRSLPPSLLASLATLVRTMNCYYSNIIEGHATHPIDIERALNNDYSREPKKRDLQREAKAHVAVQQWIDAGSLKGRAVDVESIREIHRRFCEQLPEDLLVVDNPDTKEKAKVIPGQFRTRAVRVGRHVPISPGAVPRFLARYQEVYAGLGAIDTVMSAAAAHHRLAWIHPFVDGNGRVARLLSHAMLLETLDTGAIWSIARGLARSEELYKSHLAACDQPRRNDLDGRGNLSQENLTAFTQFFLMTSIDQVNFMESLIQPDRLRTRILLWADEEIRREHLPQKSGAILEAMLYRGELPRADAAAIVGTGERQARRIVSALMDQHVVVSDSIRAPLRLAFPAALASRWMPGLFPDRTG
jgi:Fic family protein